MTRILFILALLQGSYALAQSNIDRIEYFTGSDPGFGLATPITNFVSNPDVVNHQFSPSLFAGLNPGMHQLCYRSRDANGNWGLTNFRLVYVEDSSTTPKLIENMEYFWDVDSGFGSNGAFIPATAFSDSANFQFEAYVPVHLLVGNHTLFLRCQDTEDNWSLTNRIENIFVDTITHVGLQQIGEHDVSVFPNPFQDQFTIKCHDERTMRLTLYDQSGRLVLDKNVLPNLPIDTGKLASGNYTAFLWIERNVILKAALIKN
ncbi:MAG: T9SS C-terminal target domain-containing protein [Bacteroidetes bacterium]|nr:MAG: T9SS C-terminal target domain-containing protein [Bacteroidota bacterium]